ncbi:MAG TPA: PDZ domain-containing protein [Vicinamibacterales bacterium]|jgi:hypothetical protein
MRVDQSTPPAEPPPAGDRNGAHATPSRRTKLRVPRETRLLLLTIAVSVGALLLLSRFRFPTQVPIVTPSPPPLERLAARATYDELADIITQLQARLEPGLVVLHASAPPPGADLPTAPAGAVSTAADYLPAVRIDQELTLVRLAPGYRVQSVVGPGAGVPVVLARDPLRQLALVRVPREAGDQPPHWLREQAVATRVPGYFAVAEGGRGGLTLRPLFVSRLDPVNDPRWDRPLLAMGGFADAPAGSFIFTLEGSLVGMVIDDEGLRLVVPLQSLEQSVKRLTEGPLPVPGELGISVQPLTPALAQATGAHQGLVVAKVDPDGPAGSVLQFGDVVQSINGEPTYSVEAYEHSLSLVAAGDAVKLAIIRQGQPSTVQVTAQPQPPPALPAATPASALGLTLRSLPQIGAQIIRVLPDSVAAAAGLDTGDLITRMADVEAPTAAQVQHAFATAASGAHLLVGIEREGRPLVMVLAKP